MIVFMMMVVGLGVFLINYSNPLIMILFIVFICWGMSFKVLILFNNPWLSFMLLMIFVSGLMVMYMFIISVIPNSNLKYFSISSFFFVFLLFLLLSFGSMDSMGWVSFYQNYSLSWICLVFSIVSMISVMIFVSIIIKNPFKTLKTLN